MRAPPLAFSIALRISTTSTDGYGSFLSNRLIQFVPTYPTDATTSSSQHGKATTEAVTATARPVEMMLGGDHPDVTVIDPGRQ